MCQHLKKCRHLGRCRHVPARLGADRCQHPWYKSYGLFYLDADKYWHVSAPEKVTTPGNVPTRLGADTCRHVPTSLILIILTFIFANWDVLTCVSTWKGANTWECADTCRHVKVPTRADIRHTNHMDFLFANWDVLACVSTWKSADTWEGAGTSKCRHVPTSLIPIIWTFFYLDADMYWHVSAPEKVPTPGNKPTCADTSRCRHVPTSVILIIWTILFANWDVLACVSTWKSADTWEGADTCRHPWY